jgi:murein DD-endopeptidase MepM/ murein hydrolase activator NlpD
VEPKKSRYFTLMIMPDISTVEVRRIRVSRRLITGLAVFGLTTILAGLGAVTHSAYMWQQRSENETLRIENEALRARIEGLDLRLEGVDEVIERVKQFDTKLRAITNVSDPERNLAMGPVGGTESEHRESTLGAQSVLRRDLLGPAGRGLEFVETRVVDVEREAKSTERSVSQLSSLLEDQRTLMSSTPSRAPTRGFVSSIFGMRIDPFTGLAQMHAGLDFSANIGAKVSATADGLVIFTGLDGAYGKAIRVDHGNGLVTCYGHLSKIDVKTGQQVKRGQAIGGVGNTGRSTGPHLHYEVRVNGIPQDPHRFLLEYIAAQ